MICDIWSTGCIVLLKFWPNCCCLNFYDQEDRQYNVRVIVKYRLQIDQWLHYNQVVNDVDLCSCPTRSTNILFVCLKFNKYSTVNAHIKWEKYELHFTFYQQIVKNSSLILHMEIGQEDLIRQNFIACFRFPLYLLSYHLCGGECVFTTVLYIFRYSTKTQKDFLLKLIHLDQHHTFTGHSGPLSRYELFLGKQKIFLQLRLSKQSLLNFY